MIISSNLIGVRFRDKISQENYILARTPNGLSLINLKTGNFYSEDIIDPFDGDENDFEIIE